MFLSMLSHDIKNPVQVILGYADMIQRDPDLTEMQLVLERIKENAGRILALVGDFVEVRKIEAGKLVLNLEKFGINEYLKNIADQQAGFSQTKNIAVAYEPIDGDVQISADKEYFRRALINLVDNAIKYTPDDGKVAVRARLGEGALLIEISDTGSGIPEDELPFVFDKYRRVRGQGKAEGSGLGLFIVKAVVEAHGGQIEAESTEGEGSTFRISLPMPA